MIFDLLGREVDFEPGQYFFVTLPDLGRVAEGDRSAVRLHRGRHWNHRLPQHASLIAEEGLPHRVTLVYSNRDQDSAAFLDELSALEHDNPNLCVVLTMTDDPAWEGETRRIDAELLRDHLEDDLGTFTYLVAGPPTMVEAMAKTLRDAAVPEEQIRPERFSGY